MRRRWQDVEAGAALPQREFRVTRADLVRYAGAAGDFNPIHWNERFARAVGLPDVIAHGMLTMALAARVLTEWAGDPAAVAEYGVRFTRPVVVPDDDTGATLTVDATVGDKLDGRRVALTLSARCAGVGVLSQARAVIQLA